MISHARLTSILHYDPCTGRFTWLNRPICDFPNRRACGAWNGRYAHKQAGSITDSGYVTIRIGDKAYAGHRLAFFYVTGHWPSDQIDHKNCDRSDNRFANLREATRSQNGANRSDARSSSGIKGVSWHRRHNKWQVRIGVDGKSRFVGLYSDIETARQAYMDAARSHFGEFARAA